MRQPIGTVVIYIYQLRPDKESDNGIGILLTIGHMAYTLKLKDDVEDCPKRNHSEGNDVQNNSPKKKLKEDNNKEIGRAHV